MSLDVGGGFIGGDVALRSTHLRSVAQRVLARAWAHLRFDRLQPSPSRGCYTMIPVSKEQPLFSLEDDGRQSLEYLSVVFHLCGIDVCLGIDRCGGEEVNYSQFLRHGLMVAASSKIRNSIA